MLVTKVDAVKDADGQPGILKAKIVERIYKCHVRCSEFYMSWKNPKGDRITDPY